MKLRLALVCILMSGLAHAHHGRGGQSTGAPPILYYGFPSTRVTTWDPGVTYAPTSGPTAPANAPAGWTGGIPARTTICATLSPSGADDTSAINSAISACPANETVSLTSGQFNISGNGVLLTKSYVTLRGAGPGPGMKGSALGTLPTSGTRLVKSDAGTNQHPVVTIGNYNVLAQSGTSYLSGTINTTSDATQGTYSVTVASTTGLSVGLVVYINETYDSTLTWYNTNGGQGGSSTNYNGWGECSFGCTAATSRPMGQMMEIASIVGSTVTFTTPFHKTWRTSFSAHIGILSAAQVSWAGLENVFVTGGSGGDGGGNIVFGSGSYNWAKNIESACHKLDGSSGTGGGLVHFISSFRSELRDSYVHSCLLDIPNLSSGGAYYNIVEDSYAADNLIENNIDWIGEKPNVMRGTGGGNVFGYNYADDFMDATTPMFQETFLNADHMTTSFMELFEGNDAPQMTSDSRWGNSVYITWYRNWVYSQRLSAWPGYGVPVQPAIPSSSTGYNNPLLTYYYVQSGTGNFYYEDSYNRKMGSPGSHHWDFNFVGNVLGKSDLPLLTTDRSAYTNPQTCWYYEEYGPSTPASINPQCVPIWVFGTADSSETAFGGNGLDPSVLPTTLRDANFDYWSDLVHWHGIGGTAANASTGAGGTTPPGASTTGGTTLAPSLYLPTGTPAFFHGGTFPWVDGSNASNPLPGTLPAKARFDAGTPNSP